MLRNSNIYIFGTALPQRREIMKKVKCLKSLAKKFPKLVKDKPQIQEDFDLLTTSGVNANKITSLLKNKHRK